MLKGSPFLFGLFVSLVTLIGFWEYQRMALPRWRIAGVFLSLLAALFPLLLPRLAAYELLALLTVTIIGVATLVLIRFRDIPTAAANAALFLLGLCYVPLLLGHLVLLRELANGVLWIFLMMTVVMSSDTAAYYVGSALGRHKLYPAVSPNKSVEGAIGGLVGSVLGALVFRLLFFPQLPLGYLLPVALLLGLLAQTGDLFESLLKRSFGVKDSGNLIPGHGGILDRIDSILFAAPAAYYCALYLSLYH